MNKFVSILLLLIFIVGCSHLSTQKGPDSNINSDVQVDEKVIKNDLNKEVQSGEKIITLTEGDTLTYNDYEIKVEKLSRNENLVLKIGDQIRLIDRTKEELIINDIVVLVEQFDFENNEADVRFKPLVLGSNEYVLKIRETVNIGVVRLTLDQISTDESHFVTVNVYTSYQDQESGRVREGGTIVIGGLKVTNVKTNPRPITLEKYAILRLEAR